MHQPYILLLWPIHIFQQNNNKPLLFGLDCHSLKQDPSAVDAGALTAANTLAQQRMALYKEDNDTATKVTKKTTSKGKGDASSQAQ